MSEYRYYEFQAVDRPLTADEMRELRAVSSRADITPTRVVNEYNWGDFKGNPDRWMERWFDAFLYLANWGTRHLMLRLPTDALDPGTAQRYCPAGSDDSNVQAWAHDGFVILSFLSDEEGGDSWIPTGAAGPHPSFRSGRRSPPGITARCTWRGCWPCRRSTRTPTNRSRRCRRG